MLKSAYFERIGGLNFGLVIAGKLNKYREQDNFIDNQVTINELPLAIYSRINMIKALIHRSNTTWRDLRGLIIENISDHHVYSPKDTWYSLRINRELLDLMMVDIHSFLFEIDSCCELVQKYVRGIYINHELTSKSLNYQNYLRDILEMNNLESGWYKTLNEYRNHFIHEGSVFLSIMLDDVEIKNNPKLIITKSKQVPVTEESDYILLGDLSEIVQGFEELLFYIEEKIVSDIDNKFILT